MSNLCITSCTDKYLFLKKKRLILQEQHVITYWCWHYLRFQKSSLLLISDFNLPYRIKFNKSLQFMNCVQKHVCLDLRTQISIFHEWCPIKKFTNILLYSSKIIIKQFILLYDDWSFSYYRIMTHLLIDDPTTSDLIRHSLNMIKI